MAAAQTAPLIRDIASSASFIQIEAGAKHAVALRTCPAVLTDGSFWIWGFGSSGEGILGRNLRVPTLLELP